MEAFGGATGTALWKGSQTPVRGRHIRATPCSPQFKGSWRCPFVFSCSSLIKARSLGAFRWWYFGRHSPSWPLKLKDSLMSRSLQFLFEKDQVFQGRRFVSHSPQPVMLLLPQGLQSISRGIQHELDLADKANLDAAIQQPKGGGKAL